MPYLLIWCGSKILLLIKEEAFNHPGQVLGSHVSNLISEIQPTLVNLSIPRHHVYTYTAETVTLDRGSSTEIRNTLSWHAISRSLGAKCNGLQVA